MGTYPSRENKDEIAWVKSLYPDHDGYLMFTISTA